MIEDRSEAAPLRLLFVTWDGPGLAYLESLFLPIFAGLRSFGIATDILQFRWGSRAEAEAIGRQCAALGSGYRAVTIRRWPGGVGPIASALVGALSIRAAARQFGSDVVMPRSLMPAIAALAAGGGRFRPMVFDADGLAADERVEFAGLSPQGATYRLLRDVEAQMVRQARSVIVRSSAAAAVLHARAGPPVTPSRFHVVTNGRDHKLFTFDEAERAAVRRELGIAEAAPVIVYAGSVGPQYCFDRLGDFVAAVCAIAPAARLLILSGAPDRAQAALAEHHPELAAVTIVMAVRPESVPRYLGAGDVGVAYRQPTFANRGVAPIKLSEYLLCGLPVVGTAAVGDTVHAVEAGVFLDEAGGSAAAAAWFTGMVMPNRATMRERARQVGKARFSLACSVQDYLAALAPVLGVAGMVGAEETPCDQAQSL